MNATMKCIVAVVMFTAVAADQTEAQTRTRKGLFHTTRSAAQIAENTPDASMFSLGTLFGLTVFASSDDPSTYKIQNNIVVFDEERGRAQPGVYALPSLNLWGTPGKSVSAIVPANLNTSGESSYGLGLTYGFAVGKKQTSELGFALGWIWSDVVRLTPQQQASFNGGTALPAGAVTEFRKAKRAAFSLGIYLVPLL